MAKRSAQRLARDQRTHDNHSVGASEVHSAVEPSAPSNERWQVAQAAYQHALESGASKDEAFKAAQAAYEA